MGPGAPGTATAAYRNGAPFYNAWPRSHSPFPNQLRVPPVPVILSNLDEGAPGPSLLGTGEGSSHFTVHVFAIEVFSQCRKGAHPLSANRCATGYATLLPGPRVRGTGGTLNLIEFLRRPWPPAWLRFAVSHLSTIKLWMNGALGVCGQFMTGPPAPRLQNKVRFAPGWSFGEAQPTSYA